MDRRTFVGTATSCAGYLLCLSHAASVGARRLFAAEPRGRVVAQDLWGRLEAVGPGLWAMISTPLAGDRESGAWRTVCNGGIIAGRDEVLAVEAFATVDGARWLVEQARRLTGRWPSVAVVTHFPGDHCGGLAGFGGEGSTVRVRSTETTRELLGERDALPEPTLPVAGSSLTLDLGGRTVRVTSRRGHTPSDVTIEVDDPRVVWCGDLVWNGMFPNYVHATPSQKARSVRALLAAGDAVYVPGHGGLARGADVERYLLLLDDVEEKARAALDHGDPLDQAADAYGVPASLGEWVMFSQRYFRVAFDAWRRELVGER